MFYRKTYRSIYNQIYTNKSSKITKIHCSISGFETGFNRTQQKGPQRSSSITGETLLKLFILSSDPSTSVPAIEIDSMEMKKQKYSQFWTKLYHPDWKVVKENKEKDFKVSLLKTQERTLAAKGETIFNVPYWFALDYYKNGLHQTSSQAGENTEVYRAREDKTYRMVVIYGKLPFPISSRVMTYNEWIYEPEPKHLATILENATLPPEVILKSGYIRGEVYMSGINVEEESPVKLRVTCMGHANPKGLLPVWLVNMMSSNLGAAILRQKESIEKLFHNSIQSSLI